MRSVLMIFGLLLFVLIIFFILDILTGSVYIAPLKTLSLLVRPPDNADELSMIIHRFRLPKALAAIIAGSALSVSGLQMQTIFRNPLAGPFVLGISSGASLGVALLVMTTSGLALMPAHSFLSNWSVVIAAWIGSGLVLLIILLVSIRIRDIMTILILGILFGSITAAVVSMLQYFSDETVLKTFVIWTLGSLGNVDNRQLTIMVLCTGAGLLLSLLSMKGLDALLIGEEYAKSLGINIMATRILVFSSTSLLAGTVTAFCGPIGFIGIIVPHFARLVFHTARHAVLIPASLLIGSCLLIAADIISQMPGSELILPINSVTALLGIPVVIWIVLRNKTIHMA
jgi:iron complex transport system permease protein